MKGTRTIQVDYLARVEGEGAMFVKVRDGVVEDVKLKIFEPPRFFEAFLRGRDFREAPDITARICGICPVAYQMSAVHAMEMACGVRVDGQIRELRRLLYCGEWIESHVLHVFMLHAPDFLGYHSAIELAKDMPEVVENALRFKRIGNDLMNVVGGREIHPVNVRVGGFYRPARRRELRAMVEDLKWARDQAIAATRLVSGFEFPELERDYDFVALRHPDEYAMNEGNIISSSGMDMPVQEYENHFVEEHVEHSNALHSHKVDGGSYFVGPMARFALNSHQLSPAAREVAADVGLVAPCLNPFRSIVIRAVETVYACDEALRIIAQYEEPEQAYVDVEPRAGVGMACTEAPRGILYHRYRIDGEGRILEAKITPPTAQNQKTIEEDLREFVKDRVDMEQDKLRWECEQAIRNYDPCISCATHFLDLTMDRK